MKPSNKRIPNLLEYKFNTNRYPTKNERTVSAILHGFNTDKFVTRNTYIATIGSCFAQELKKYLVSRGFNCAKDEWGVVYNIKCIRQVLQQAFDPVRFMPNEPFWIMDERFYDPYRKSSDHSGPTFLGQNEMQVHQSLTSYIKRAGDILKKIDLMVMTLGLTETWRNKTDHYTFYATPYEGIYNPDKHEFYNLSFDDIRFELEIVIALFAKYNPNAKLLFTVSPIPLVYTMRANFSSYIANNFSKSSYLAAVYEAYSKHSNVYYMPSFEIAISDIENNFKEDGRHPTDLCIRKIMSAFEALFVV